MKLAENNNDSRSRDLAAARNVFEKGVEGLQALEEWLDDSFIQALDVLGNLKGRVIISGMGKSGHIGNKIAATLASTGTPAFFIHPGEASHGDLGMVTKHDALVLLSNSGETAELKDLINYAKRFSVPLVAIVRRKTSVLVNAADVALVLPEVPEACEVNAPTTSTTMMLALGDALAVALLERKGFSDEDFSVFHPGGKLGAAFIKVKDLMHKGDQLPLVKEHTPMPDVLLEMTAKRFGCAGVLDEEEKFVGVITDGDLRRHMDGITDKTAVQVMTKDPVTVRADALVSRALAKMEKRSITALFVVADDGTANGIVHIHDLLRAGVA